MVVDKSGALGGVKRHDYLPFGEELGAGIGGRTTSQGYSQPDGVRQRYTGKERDDETGLDYFLARYYSSTQGRFTSVDIAGPDLTNPQTLNKYQYCLNNPLRYIDRRGLYEEDVHRDLTYVLALAAGFNSVSAREISNADQGVDDNPKTSPMGMTPWGKDVETRELYHFTTEERRGEMWQAFEQSGSHERLGEFFHAQQDSFSHAGYGARFGHLSDGHAPDKTYTDPDKADRMAGDTYSRMQNALTIGIRRGSETRYYTAVDWKKIAPMVQAFNRAKTPEEKQKIIDQIEVVARRQQLQQDEQRRREEERRRHGGRSQ
jgi:RHS repeat-associated protein